MASIISIYKSEKKILLTNTQGSIFIPFGRTNLFIVNNNRNIDCRILFAPSYNISLDSCNNEECSSYEIS